MATNKVHKERSRRQYHKIRALRNWWFNYTGRLVWLAHQRKQMAALGANKPSDASAAQ